MGVVRGVFVIRAELDSREFREAINRNFERIPCLLIGVSGFPILLLGLSKGSFNVWCLIVWVIGCTVRL